MKSNVQRFNQLSKEYYILFMLILLMFRAIGPYSLLPSIVDNLLYAAGAIFGSIIILIDLVNIVRGKKKWNYNWWLIGFLVVIFISSIVNRRYGITGNIKLLVWQFFSCLRSRTRQRNFSKINQKIHWFTNKCMVCLSVSFFNNVFLSI